MDSFSPSVWPEHKPPPMAKSCQKCELAKGRSRVIWGEGNPRAPVVIILDNPGAREDKEGREYVCGTRQTLQKGAYTVGLGPEDLFVTYLLKCRPRRKYDKEFARRTCREHLWVQIEEQRPILAFCLGDTAVQWFFDDFSVGVKALRGQLYAVRGLQTGVSYHPLAVRRRPNLEPYFLEDWRLLANTLRGQG